MAKKLGVDVVAGGGLGLVLVFGKVVQPGVGIWVWQVGCRVQESRNEG